MLNITIFVLLIKFELCTWGHVTDLKWRTQWLIIIYIIVANVLIIIIDLVFVERVIFIIRCLILSMVVYCLMLGII